MENPLNPVAAPSCRFSDLGLSAAALASIEAAGYTTPTPVQERAIPPALEGLDVIACAATGTGKTAAFLLPILERIQGGKGTRVLILAPTRELVLQTAEFCRTFGAGRHVRCVEIVGGLGFEAQTRGLRDRCDVIVATPGRLLDHMERGAARLEGIQILVLDEADRMLDLGFKPQLDRILAKLPRERQTMLFSATMGREVADFARKCLRDPVKVEVAKSGTVAARATQQVFHVPQASKPSLLLWLLAQDKESTLVFTRTKHRADRLTRTIEKAGHRVACIHGNRSQSQRVAALDGFKTGRVRILVATDIAARGIDVEDIGHVVNFDLSHVPDDHVHRVGRTARASAAGRASSFCAPEEITLLRDIERFTRNALPRAPLPEGFAVSHPEPVGAASGSDRPARSGPSGGGRRGPSSRPHTPRRDTGSSHGTGPSHGTGHAHAAQPRAEGGESRPAGGHRGNAPWRQGPESGRPPRQGWRRPR